MNKIFFFLVLACIATVNAVSQRPAISLGFSATYNNQPIALDSVYVVNYTLECDTTIYSPATVLVINYTLGIPETDPVTNDAFVVRQNYPNPMGEQTVVEVMVRTRAAFDIMVSGMNGQKILNQAFDLDAGNHEFTFFPGNEPVYIFSVLSEGDRKTITMTNLSRNPRGDCRLLYTGHPEAGGYKKSPDVTNLFRYRPGDILRYFAYSQTTGLITGSGFIEDIPDGNKTYTFEIVEGIPCRNSPFVKDGSTTYTTVQIGNQCWLRENLNAGDTVINGADDMHDNGILEKYCYDNAIGNCNEYGGLYQWDEAMQYTQTSGARGICPAGWHIPTTIDWYMLSLSLNGLVNAGGPMKETGTGHWSEPNTGATNSSGFTGLPGGLRVLLTNPFGDLTLQGYFWSSDGASGSAAMTKYLSYDQVQLSSLNCSTISGCSVRCIRDE